MSITRFDFWDNSADDSLLLGVRGGWGFVGKTDTENVVVVVKIRVLVLGKSG